MRLKCASIFFVIFLVSIRNRSLADTICDFDGDGFSEIALVSQNQQGKYDWVAFDPRTGRAITVTMSFGDTSSKLIPGNWFQKGRAAPAIVTPVSDEYNGRASWIGRSIDYLGGTEVVRMLGRSGDLIIHGGDYDGNGITDSLILKKTTNKLGLRVNFFLSSYDGNNLGTERLYRGLGRAFQDANFFFSPDGITDHLAVMRAAQQGDRQALRLKPFTDSPQRFRIGRLPSGSSAPYPVRQGVGLPDLLAFAAPRSATTLVTVKTLSGQAVFRKSLPGGGTVTVGDYLDEPGWEIAVQDGQQFSIVNPRTRAMQRVEGPGGRVVSCFSNQQID